MGKKKVLIIIDNLLVGGGQSVVLELVKYIDSSIFDVSVICCGVKKNTSIETEIEQICPVTYVGINNHIGVFEIRKVLSQISKISPDVIHAHLGGITFAMPWCLLHRKPLVVTAHTIPEKAFSKKNEILLRLGLRLGKVKLVAVSKENYLRCKEYFSLSDDKCSFVNNGVDANRYYSSDHEGFVFINVATHNENKNQGVIIKCISDLHKKNHDVRLILVGDGETHCYLMDEAKRLGIENIVEFPGLVSNVEDYYAKADVYVQSSHREALPMSMLEALMVGLPIVSTNVGGVKDIVDGNGYLVEDNSENELLHAIEKMCSLTNLQYDEMSKKSKLISENYSSENMAKKYMELFNSIT